jgi:hypothetical protein
MFGSVGFDSAYAGTRGLKRARQHLRGTARSVPSYLKAS